MPLILTVDDSRAVRSIVSKQVAELGFEIDEAEDGQQALDKLENIACDLILLDVTMPVMDGPTMLARLRERGDKTPVIMLTSEAKRSIVAEAMKLGIEDYILKPFKPEELIGKIRTALKLGAPAPKPGGAAAAAAPSAESASQSARQFIDLLVVDDMENVAKRLRGLVPAHISLNAFTSAQSALNACRETMYRVVLLDTEMPDVDSIALAGQLRALQPHASVVAMSLKTGADAAALKEQGFPEVLYKPFSPEGVEDFLLQYFDKQELLLREDNLLKVAAFQGRQDRLERYFVRLTTLFSPALEQVAAACFEDAIVDLTKASLIADRTPKLLAGIAEKARSVGLQVRLVGGPELGKLISGFEETRALPLYPSLNDARAATS